MSTLQRTNAPTDLPDNIVIRVENVSKKFCKSMKRSMFYGVRDIGRNILGLSSHSDRLLPDEFWAVDNASFELKKGETLGIIGPNGSGKTTMLKMLNGIFWPDKGKISIRGRVGALIAVGAGFHPMLTGRENIFVNGAILGMGRLEMKRKFDAIVAFADIGDFLDSPVSHYSSGMYVRLGFAIAAHCEPEILLIDEVLAVGDIGFQHKCFNKIGELREKGTSSILVSHNMHVISVFTSKVFLIHGGQGHYFNDASAAIEKYGQLFIGSDNDGIARLCSGNHDITFHDIMIEKTEYMPGESFVMSMPYESSKPYENVEIDLKINNREDPMHYFQATNKAYDKKVMLQKGKHRLDLKIKNLRIHNSRMIISVAVWSENRRELLFRWKIPVKFNAAPHVTGRNFLEVEYENV